MTPNLVSVIPILQLGDLMQWGINLSKDMNKICGKSMHSGLQSSCSMLTLRSDSLGRVRKRILLAGTLIGVNAGFQVWIQVVL